MRIRTKLALFALFLTYCLAAFAILSPLLVALTNNWLFWSTGFTFVFFFVIFAWAVASLLPIGWKGIFSILDNDEIPKWWLRLHTLFTYISNALFMVIAVLCVMIPLLVQDYNTAFPLVFMLTGVAFLLSLLGLWQTHSVIGMGYKWFYKGTFLGIQSLSSLAFEAFQKKRIKGTKYLLDALLMFQEYLRRHGSRMKNWKRQSARYGVSMS